MLMLKSRIARAKVNILRRWISKDKRKAYVRYMKLSGEIAPDRKNWPAAGKTAFKVACKLFVRDMAGCQKLKRATRCEDFKTVVDIRAAIEKLELKLEDFISPRVIEAYSEMGPGYMQLFNNSLAVRGGVCELLAAHDLAVKQGAKIVAATPQVFDFLTKAMEIFENHGLATANLVMDSNVRIDEPTNTNGKVLAENNGLFDIYLKSKATGELSKLQVRSSMMKVHDKNSLRVQVDDAPGCYLVGVVFVPEPYLFVKNNNATYKLTIKTISRCAKTPELLRNAIVRDCGAVRLDSYADDVVIDLISLVRANQNAILDTLSFFPESGFESDNVRKAVLERLVCSTIPGSSMMPYGSPFDMFVEFDGRDTLVRIEAKGGDLCYDGGRNKVFNVRATGVKPHNADVFKMAKVVNSFGDEGDSRPMMIVSTFNAVLFDDGKTINPFATPYVSTTGERQFTEGFDYKVYGPYNTPNTRAGQIVSLEAIISKTARSDSLLSKSKVLAAVGITPALLASAKAEVAAFRKLTKAPKKQRRV